MIRFLHAADIHLDSPLRGLERYEGCPADEMRRATRDAFVRLIDVALEEAVSFVVIAGDLYDGAWDDYSTALFLAGQFAKLRDAGIPIVLISGNHDAQNKMTNWLRLPENVHRLSADKPETLLLREFDVALHGQSFAQAKTLDDLSAGYPKATPGVVNIGVLHTCATGAEGHDPYAPCTIEGLRAKGYDYWALGHIHKAGRLCEDPWIVFPGNTQGRSVRETGPKGCQMVSVDRHGKVESSFRKLSVARWEILNVAVEPTWKIDDVMAGIVSDLREMASIDSDRLAARIVVTGANERHAEWIGRARHFEQQLRHDANVDLPGQVWIEKIQWKTALPKNAVVPDAGLLAELSNLIADLQTNEASAAAFAEPWDEWKALRKKLADVSPDLSADPLADAAGREELLREVEAILRHRLSDGESS